MVAQHSTRLTNTLSQRVAQGVNSAEIVAEIISSWQAIDAALRPIIGAGGVSALYKRSVYLTAPSFPWLKNVAEIVSPTIDLAALKYALIQQSSIDAAAGGGALLQTLYELLVSLIGTTLTQRLLHSTWTNTFGGESAQDVVP